MVVAPRRFEMGKILAGLLLLVILLCAGGCSGEHKDPGAELDCHDLAVLHGIENHRVRYLATEGYVVRYFTSRCEFEIENEWIGATVYLEWLETEIDHGSRTQD